MTAPSNSHRQSFTAQSNHQLGPAASVPNDRLPHWELGYHVSERCAACQHTALAPLVLVCPCSLKHALCASHLDLFRHTLLHSDPDEHGHSNEMNPPEGRLKRRRRYSDSGGMSFCLLSLLGRPFSHRCIMAVNHANIDNENPDPLGPSLQRGSEPEINAFGPTLGQGHVQYRSVGVQAGDSESTTHEGKNMCISIYSKQCTDDCTAKAQTIWRPKRLSTTQPSTTQRSYQTQPAPDSLLCTPLLQAHHVHVHMAQAVSAQLPSISSPFPTVAV